MDCQHCGNKMEHIDLVPREEFYVVGIVEPNGDVNQVLHVASASNDLKAQCQYCGKDVTDQLNITIDVTTEIERADV